MAGNDVSEYDAALAVIATRHASLEWPEAWWFGCTGNRPGHGWLGARGRKPKDYRYGPLSDHIDGKYAPKWSPKQGHAAINHVDGYTLVSFHDYSVDTRGNSNGNFVIKGDLTFEEAMGWAATIFPSIVKRVGPIQLVEEGD